MAPISSQVPSVAQLEADQSTLVLRQFRVVFNAVRSHFQQVERQVGVGGAMVWALNVIQWKPGLGVNDLALSMDIHQSTASNLVRQLIHKGLIQSEKSTTDRRSVQLTVTSAGLALLQRVPGPFEGVLPQALHQLSPDTLGRLHQDLHALIQILQADESAGMLPLAQL